MTRPVSYTHLFSKWSLSTTALVYQKLQELSALYFQTFGWITSNINTIIYSKKQKATVSSTVAFNNVLSWKNFTSFTTTSCKNTTSVFSWHTVTESVFTLTTDFTWLISTFHVEYLLIDFRIRLAGYFWSVTKHTILFYSNSLILSRIT